MSNILIDVTLEDGTKKKMDIDYVLACELSKLNVKEFDIELIKAIAVLKRSEISRGIKSLCYYDVNNEGIHLNETIYNVLLDKEKKVIKDAIESTENIIAICGENAVELFYTKSCSGGTANSEDIIGRKVNYLRRVICRKCSMATYNKLIRIQDFADKINKRNSHYKDEIVNIIKDVVRDETGRIISINFLGTKMTGEEFMEFFQVNSNRVYFLENTLEFKTLGEGRGLGICLMGANKLATEGYNYQDIINYYYTGIEFKYLDGDKIGNSLCGKKIIIDPGHGGDDFGNINGEIIEKEVNFKIGKHLFNMLNELKCNVELTRGMDENILLSERVNFINRKRPDFYISIHQNSFMLPGVNGIEIYCYEKDYESIRLGEMICENIASEIHIKNRGVRSGNYYILRECKVNGLVIECMYVSGNQDIQKYNNNNYKTIAGAIFNSICRYYEINGD